MGILTGNTIVDVIIVIGIIIVVVIVLTWLLGWAGPPYWRMLDLYQYNSYYSSSINPTNVVNHVM
jgi:hypothetical protein